ncbi:MAG: hypothetical protein IT449_08780 [Phycisphaerales bacterium]|nr:hypothetical protein [Phycisphaerales bacterium]
MTFARTASWTLRLLVPCLLGLSAAAQDVPHKPGWEEELEVLKRTGQLPKEDKPGLGGKEQMSKFEQLMNERLRLTAQQQERIHAILIAHAGQMLKGETNKKSFADEHGQEYKELRKQAEEAKQAKDKEKLKSIMERLSQLRQQQLSAKSQASPDYSSLIADIEKELTRAQVDDFLKLVEELGMSKDEDAGAKLLPKEYIHIITSAGIGLSDDQHRQITTIYKQTQEDARKLGEDKSKLPPLLAKMRADIRAVLEPTQRRVSAQLLLKAEGRSQKQTPQPGAKEGQPGAEDSEPGAEGGDGSTAPPPAESGAGKHKSQKSGKKGKAKAESTDPDAAPAEGGDGR